jgi:hypothetical protein
MTLTDVFLDEIMNVPMTGVPRRQQRGHRTRVEHEIG